MGSNDLKCENNYVEDKKGQLSANKVQLGRINKPKKGRRANEVQSREVNSSICCPFSGPEPSWPQELRAFCLFNFRQAAFEHR